MKHPIGAKLIRKSAKESRYPSNTATVIGYRNGKYVLDWKDQKGRTTSTNEWSEGGVEQFLETVSIPIQLDDDLFTL